MNLLKRLLMGIGATALIAVVFTLFVPKTAHAVVAALVQVVNTTSSPAITLDISHSASQTATLWCFLQEPTCYLVTASSGLSALDTVPAGKNFVATTVDIAATSPVSIGLSGFVQPIGLPSLGYQWSVPGDGNTHSFQYPSGIVFPAGYQFTNSTNVFLAPGLKAFVLYGFMTSN